MAKRKKGRHRGAAGKANADLDTHILSLGLKTLGQYQAWCRDQGFNGALNKSWQERRQERKVADLAIDQELMRHIVELGLKTVEDYTAWCSAQGLSTGIQKSNAQPVNGTRLSDSFGHEDFWHTVVHFFVNNPMLDPDQVGPIVDFIQNQKYEPREEVVDGETIELPPEQPNFAIKARSMDKLLHQMEMWHRGLTRKERLPPRVWAPSDITPLEWAQTDKYDNALCLEAEYRR